MSAAQISPPRPKKKSPSRQKKQKRRQIPRYSGLTLEISAKILVNVVLATAAIAAINKLVPNYQTQRLRLEEVQQEVKQTQARVNALNQAFSRNFDPYQSEVIMQEQTNQIKPNQRHVVWLEPSGE